jgi:riboflavin transporter FmnP
MKNFKVLTFAALMAALTNILSIEPFAIPIILGPFGSKIHLSQLPIFLSGCIAGPWAGLITGSIGGLYMSFTAVPFIIGGLGLLGFSSGFIYKRLNLRPFQASILAWIIQSIYVFLTDYFWFTSINMMSHNVAVGVVTNILIKLSVEVIISSVLVEILIYSITRAGYISFFE